MLLDPIPMNEQRWIANHVTCQAKNIWTVKHVEENQSNTSKITPQFPFRPIT